MRSLSTLLPFLPPAPPAPEPDPLTPEDRLAVRDLVRLCRAEHAALNDPALSHAVWAGLIEPDAIRSYTQLHAALLYALGHPGVDGVRTPDLDADEAADVAHIRSIIRHHRHLMRYTEDPSQCDRLRQWFAARMP